MSESTKPPVPASYTVTTDRTPAVPVPMDLLKAMNVWLQWLKDSMTEADVDQPGSIGPDVIKEVDRLSAHCTFIMQTAALIYFRRLVPVQQDPNLDHPANAKGC